MAPEGVWFAVTMGKAVNCLDSYSLIEAVRPLAMQICSAQVDLVDRGAFTVDTRQRIADSGNPWLVNCPHYAQQILLFASLFKGFSCAGTLLPFILI